MYKAEILRRIAELGLEIGLKGARSRASYNVYTFFPKGISIMILITGFFQFTEFYKDAGSLIQEGVSCVLITLGFIGLIIDIFSEKRNKYNDANKKSLNILINLSRLYKQVELSNKPNSTFPKEFATLDKLEEENIENELLNLTEFPGTKLYSRLLFFNDRRNKWINEELKLKLFQKYPLNWELITILVVFIVLIVILIRLSMFVLNYQF